MTDQDEHPKNHRVERHIDYALAILGVLLALLLGFLILQYRALRQEQLVNERALHWSFLQHHAPLPVSEANIIRSWMTFDYINKLFALPPDYLKTQLQITDTHYPRLSISSYAKDVKLDQATVLGQVESAVRDHVAPSNATNTAPAASAAM